MNWGGSISMRTFSKCRTQRLQPTISSTTSTRTTTLIRRTEFSKSLKWTGTSKTALTATHTYTQSPPLSKKTTSVSNLLNLIRRPRHNLEAWLSESFCWDCSWVLFALVRLKSFGSGRGTTELIQLWKSTKWSKWRSWPLWLWGTLWILPNKIHLSKGFHQVCYLCLWTQKMRANCKRS